MLFHEHWRWRHRLVVVVVSLALEAAEARGTQLADVAETGSDILQVARCGKQRHLEHARAIGGNTEAHARVRPGGSESEGEEGHSWRLMCGVGDDGDKCQIVFALATAEHRRHFAGGSNQLHI